MFRTVFGSTCVALLSTLLCYANFAAAWVNWYVALGLDSVVNDLCLIVVAFPGAVALVRRRLRGEAAGDEFGLPSLAAAQAQPPLLTEGMRHVAEREQLSAGRAAADSLSEADGEASPAPPSGTV